MLFLLLLLLLLLLSNTHTCIYIYINYLLSIFRFVVISCYYEYKGLNVFPIFLEME